MDVSACCASLTVAEGNLARSTAAAAAEGVSSAAASPPACVTIVSTPGALECIVDAVRTFPTDAMILRGALLQTLLNAADAMGSDWGEWELAVELRLVYAGIVDAAAQVLEAALPCSGAPAPPSNWADTRQGLLPLLRVILSNQGPPQV